ncbi:MAG: hypothetical protein ACK559_01250, partial [bacterium]
MSNSSDVLFFNATVNNDTASIAAAINEEDMNIDCTIDTKLTKAVQLSQLPKSANSSSSNYPYS